jgi:uncharacterized membrane protein YozB (DUF420 family)
MPPLWPGVNSGFNACATLCIIAGLIAVKRGRVEGHKKFMLAAFALSVCFLASYVAYHAMGNETPYPEDAPGRGGYLILLASHVLLAMPTAILVPIVVWLGVRDRLDRGTRGPARSPMRRPPPGLDGGPVQRVPTGPMRSLWRLLPALIVVALAAGRACG